MNVFDLPFELHPIFSYGVMFVLVFAVASVLVLSFIAAPYGRHASEGWGPTVKAKYAWLIMELPSPLSFAVVYFMSDNAMRLVPLILMGMYMVHYLYRTFIFPFRMRGGDKQKPILTAGLAILFNFFNGSLNAYAITELAPHLTPDWLSDPRFIVGAIVFAAGYFINHQSDGILRNLRKPGETGYKIPHGGLYRWISSPNYFGELVEWTGFALAAWTAPAWAFALFTATNLVPRSVHNHRWYKENFADYPENRKAILPFFF